MPHFFSDKSVEAGTREEAGRGRKQRLRLRLAQATAAILAILLLAALGFAYIAIRDRTRAEANLALARQVVDQSLESADRDPSRVAADPPQLEEFRSELLQKAGTFYAAFLKEAPRSESARRDAAFGHFRMGQINRLTQKPEQAANEYREAIAGFQSLAAAYPLKPEYRAALANAQNWLGETLRPDAARFAEAEGAYNSAVQLQEELSRADPANPQYPQEHARSFYNRGILRSARPERMQAAEADFREALRLLEPLAATVDRAGQELARAYNNLGSLMSGDAQRIDEVQSLWERAIAIDERLSIRDPGNREYKSELATYCSNLASLLNTREQFAEADRRSREAVDLLDALGRPVPTLAIARADAHGVRGMILESLDAPGSQREYTTALDMFDQMRADPNLRRLPEFHQRFADLLLNLAEFPKGGADLARARQLLARAVGVYAEVAARVVASGTRAEAQTMLDHLSRALPQVPEPEQARLTELAGQLQQKLASVDKR